MGKIYSFHTLFNTGALFFVLLSVSCKKEHTVTPVQTPAKPIATLGLYEYQSTLFRRVFIPITQVGNVTTNYLTVFDTGSSAMTLDADGLIPASLITSSGITITGDSLVVNGITVTKQTATLTYGDATAGLREYGNLAYATIKMGDANGSLTTKRIPFFMYYKAVDLQTGKADDPHQDDVFGVGPNTRFSNFNIASPLSYFTTPDNVTQGFKLSRFDKAAYSINPTYVANLLTIGLVPADLDASSGFIMHSLSLTSAGYSPNIPATITYNGTSIQGTLLFDTGTPAFANIEDPNASTTQTILPANSAVTITTNSGFSYQYTTTSDYNLTQIDNPSVTHDPRTIFSIDFFADNEYLLDYTHHKIGLKNN